MAYGNGRNGQSNSHPQLWRTPTHVFAIMVTRAWAPVACKLTLATGQWETFDLSALPGNPLRAPVDATDAHRGMAMAVDSFGHVLVCGNLHTDPVNIVRTTSPGDITSWVPASPDISSSGDPLECTYPAFSTFSDGELWLQLAQQDVGQSSDGRDSVIYRLPSGSTGWEPVVGTGDLMVASGSEDPGPGTGAPNRRAYLLPGFVDADDVYHGWGVWRLRSQPVSQRDLFYVRTLDRGTTWENVAGAPVTVPLTHPTTLQEAQVTGAVDPLNNGNLALDANGGVHGTFRGFFTDSHFWWDGTAWNVEDLSELGFADVPAVSFVRGNLWFTGVRGGRLVSIHASTGAEAMHGEASPPALPAPGVAFPDGATYLPAPQHEVTGITTFFLPQGDEPRIYSLGEGSRRRSVVG